MDSLISENQILLNVVACSFQIPSNNLDCTEKALSSKKMFPQQWSSPCNNQCTSKFAALTQIPWRVFCKKGCDTDGETWEECLAECNEICYKDPLIKDHQWSAYIDRSPGADTYSMECFHACVAGCGYKFDISLGKVDQVHPNRPPKPCIVSKPPPLPPPEKPIATEEEIHSMSA